MNEIVNSFLLAKDKCMPEMHLILVLMDYLQKKKKKKEIIRKFRERENSRYIYENQLDKACFQCDMDYRCFKSVTRRSASDKILGDETFNTAKNSKCDGYQEGLASMVDKTFGKNTADGAVKNEFIQNKELDKELHKVIIRKF